MESIEFRELAMAENVRRLVRDRGTSERVIFFAHDYYVKNHHLAGSGDHPQRLSNGALTAGAYLRSMFGRDLVIIGTVFGTAPRNIRDQIVPYPVAEPGGVEELFGKAGMPRFLVDLRRLPGNGPLHEVFYTPHRMRTFNIADQYEEVPLATAFDAVLYLDHVTQYRPLPSAARSQSSGADGSTTWLHRRSLRDRSHPHP